MGDMDRNNIAFRLNFYYESIFYILLILFGIICIDTTVVNELDFMVTEYIDSALYSQIVGCLLIVCVSYLWIKSIKSNYDSCYVSKGMLEGGCLTIGYTLSFVYIGFYVSTFVFLFIYSALIDENKIIVWKTFNFALGATIVFYTFFSLFKIYLPAAWLF